jgi:hypothetical protein
VSGARREPELHWPFGADGRDLREMADKEVSRFVDNFLVDQRREIGWFTAANPRLRLVYGFLFHRRELPWLNLWEASAPASADRPAMLARAFEPSNTPTDGSLRALVAESSLFGVPTCDWLDAGGQLTKRLCAFVAAAPAGFSGVHDVRLEADRLILSELEGARFLRIPFRRGRFMGTAV